jgi:membrane associated rhomboid family serine protease
LGSLRKVIPTANLEKIWQLHKTAKSSHLNCPQCRQKMKVINESSTELDICFNCHLAWLDIGELTGLQMTLPIKSEAEYKVEYGRALLKMHQDRDSFLSSLKIESTDLVPRNTWKYFLCIFGLPVEENDSDILTTPWATLTLFFLCTIVSLWSFKNLDWALENLSFFANLSFVQTLVRMISAPFFHIGVFHLLVNMYMLWVFGDNVEHHIGKKRFFILYGLSTLVGFVLFKISENTTLPILGSSAGISGLTTFYIYTFPRRRFIVFWPLRHFGIFRSFRLLSIPSVLFGALFFFLETIRMLAEISTHRGGISNLANLAGAFVGLFFGWYWSPRREMIT